MLYAPQDMLYVTRLAAKIDPAIERFNRMVSASSLCSSLD
jgi:hypothetical protein